MTTAWICIALLGLLVFGLGLFVSLGRGANNTVIGHASDPTDPLFKRVRAHGNAAEYAPMLAVLIYVLATTDPGVWTQSLMALAVLSRYLHAAGMLFGPTLAAPHPLRFAGALGTYVFGLIMTGMLARYALTLLTL